MNKSPAQSLRTLADKMQAEIDGKFRQRLENTHKRAREAESQREDGRRLQKVQDKLRSLADAWDTGTVPAILNRVRTKSMVDRLVLTKHFPSDTYDPPLHKAFVNAWIKDQETYERAREALLALGNPDAGQKTKADLIKDKERELIGTKIPGYFPTPKAIIDQMLDLVDLQPGMMVLEPSAGKGNIADAITERCPDVILDVVEWNYSLTEILKYKGHNVIGDDCLKLKPEDGLYDVILMNPPFEGFQDIEHVQAMFKLVKPGGMLVSVMSESAFYRQDKKASDFREWYEQEFGYDIDLPAGAFKDSERSTGVKTRLLVLEKVVEHKKIYESSNVTQLEQPTPEVLIDRIEAQGERVKAAVERLKALNAPPPLMCDLCQGTEKLVLDDAPVGKRRCWKCLLGEIKDLEQQRLQASKKVNGHLYAMGYLDKSAICYELVPVSEVITHVEACFRRTQQPTHPRGYHDWVNAGLPIPEPFSEHWAEFCEAKHQGWVEDKRQRGELSAATSIVALYPAITKIETTFIRKASVPVREWVDATMQLKMF